jgi:hypothetical protein|tara:strand:- start:24940 stop:25350 length:411 start_codon:yes stop_codon:yes gene_type:complete
MATLVYTNAKIEINGVNLSAHASEVGLNFASEMQDETAMGDDTRVRKGGLKDWSIDVTWHQDFAAGAVDATLFSLVGTTVCVELRPQNICSTAINPTYSGIACIESYNPVGGAVGALLDAPTTLQSAGSLSRASSS